MRYLGQTLLRDLYSHYNDDRSIMMMKRRANPDDSIAMDLISEILSRLPAKSVARFRCVSKPWRSIICRQDFTKLFHTVSLSNPRLLVGVVQGPCDWSFFSSPQPQNHYGKSSSLVVAADFHTKFSGGCFSYVSGMLYLTQNAVDDVVRVICNPRTGQYAILPPDDLRTRDTSPCGHLVFDPIGKQFKVMVLNEICNDGLVYHILTLGTEKEKWREIKGPSMCRAICINGVLFYYNLFGFLRDYYQIGCFDVRSEKFKFLHVDPDVGGLFQKLINSKGKLCGFNLEYGHDGGFPLTFGMWVLEDVEEGEWSTYAYTAGNGNTLVEMHYDLKAEWSTYAYTAGNENTLVEIHYDLSVVGVTASGEIVLVKHTANTPFYVLYFNPVTNTLLSVEIQGVGEVERYHSVCFVDHVEDLDIDFMKTTTYVATSIPKGQGFTNEKTSSNNVTYPDEPEIPKERDVVQMHGQNIVGLDGVKLVKDIEEIKLKVDALESELKQVELITKEIVKEVKKAVKEVKKIVKQVHNRDPLSFVCVVALIGIGIGYCMRIGIPLLFVVVVALVSIVIGYCMRT